MYVISPCQYVIFYIKDLTNPRMYSIVLPEIWQWDYATPRDWNAEGYEVVSEKWLLLRGIPLCTTTKLA